MLITFLFGDICDMALGIGLFKYDLRTHTVPFFRRIALSMSLSVLWHI